MTKVPEQIWIQSDHIPSHVALEEVVSKAESFRLGRYLTVQRRGNDRWAVATVGMVVNPDLEEEYEMNPSSRTDEFIERTRYSLDEAFSIAKAFAARAKLEDRA